MSSQWAERNSVMMIVFFISKIGHKWPVKPFMPNTYIYIITVLAAIRISV